MNHTNNDIVNYVHSCHHWKICLLFQHQMSSDIMQYHYTMWPDHGTPEPLNLAVFHSEVLRTSTDENTTPMVVHCRYKRWYWTWNMPAFKCKIRGIIFTVVVLNKVFFWKVAIASAHMLNYCLHILLVFQNNL